MELVPLGTNGYIPSAGRHTMCFLVREGPHALLLDAGTGLARLGEPGIAARLAGVETLDVVLTHYHLDHVVGLAYLAGLWTGRRVRLHGPGPPLVEGDLGTAVERLFAPPLFVRASEQPVEWELVAHDGREWTVGPWTLSARAQRHKGGSVGLRLGDHLAYVTDTEADDETVPFAAGVGLLLHEVWWTAEELAATGESKGHSSDRQVAAIARAAEVGAVAPVHHRPDRSDEGLAVIRDRLRRESGREVRWLEEGMAVRLG